MSKRLFRIAGVSVLTGATVLSQSGVASASVVTTSDTEDASVAGKSDRITTLSEKYATSATAEPKTTELKKIELPAADIKSEVKLATQTQVTPAGSTCPTDKAAQILGYTYTANGTSGIKKLAGATINPGDTVKVDFKIAEGCNDVEVSFVSYDAPTGTFSRETASKQVLHDFETGKFDAGTHSMDVRAPKCYYQLDLVRGGVLKTLGPDHSNNFYADQGRLMDARNGGVNCVTPPKEEPKVEVKEVILDAPAPIVVVKEVALAKTGASDTLPLATLAAALMLMGAAMERTSRHMRNSRQTVSTTSWPIPAFQS